MSQLSSGASLLEQALCGTHPRRTPCICPGGMMNMLTAEMMERCGAAWPMAHGDAAVMARLAAFPYENDLFDNIGVPFCMTVEAEAMGARVDLGDLYTEPRVTEYAVSSVENLSDLTALDVTCGRVKVVLDAIRILAEQHPGAALIGNLTGPISTASSVADANFFYRELRKKKEAAHALVDFVTDQLVAFGKAQIAAGAAYIAVSDPSGTGEILGPKLFEEYALPALNRICRELRPLCRGVIIHICGQLHAIYPQLRRLESDAISVDAVVNVRELRENVPGKAIMGNVSTFALANGRESAIRGLCRSCLAGGVDILAPACGLGTTSRVESIALMMQCAREAAEEGTHA